MACYISSIEGNRQKLDGGAMFGNAPKALWSQWIAADENNCVELACRAMLLELENTKILFETGIGAFFEPKLALRYGVQNSKEHVLLENLDELGVSEEDIDYVVLSHLHFDHAGGLLPKFDEIRKGKKYLHFPRAKYVLGSVAFERARRPHPRDKASYIPLLNELLEKSGRLQLVQEGTSAGLIEDHLSFIFSEGHTPGQMHSIIRGEHETIFFCGDLIPGVAWVHAPITMGYDRFPEKLIDEKHRFYAGDTHRNILLFYTHDPVYCVSKFSKSENGKIKAVDKVERLERLVL